MMMTDSDDTFCCIANSFKDVDWWISKNQTMAMSITSLITGVPKTLILTPLFLTWMVFGTLLQSLLQSLRIIPSPAIKLIDLRNKVCIVTGSNTGVGLRTATALVKCGATVIFACRSKNKAMEAIESVKAETRESNTWANSAKLLFFELDLSKIKSVRNFIEEIKKSFNRLDIVVLNAGLNTGGLTSDGLDSRWQVNYLGHWLLVSELLPLLHKGQGPNNDGSRVVLLSSVCHHFGISSLFKEHCQGYSDDLSTRMRQNASVYSDSKLAMNYLAFSLQQKFDLKLADHDKNNENDHIHDTSARIGGRYEADASIIQEKETLLQNDSSTKNVRPRSVSVNPGAVASDIWRGVPWMLRKFIMDPLMTLAFLNTDEGAATSIQAALHPLPTSQLEQSVPPYYSPYYVPSFFGFSFPLPFETMGPFVGSRVCPQTLPDQDEMTLLADQLWQLSKETVNRLEKLEK